MLRNIAIVTTSGKAYFKLVSEFKKRQLPFLSLTPKDAIPLYVKVAITTESERDSVHCSGILTYDEKMDPSKVVDEAVQLIRGKTKYKDIIIGIDPGKKFGLAILGDGAILEIAEYMCIKETVKEIVRRLDEIRADKKIIKIGNGVKEYQMRLFDMLDEMLPRNIDIESVKEERTTKNIEKLWGRKKGLIDALSAVRISMRRGRRIVRKLGNGKDS
jgi:hypothetical protein